MNLFTAIKQANIEALGTNPVNFYEFGHAPNECPVPYATWQIVAAEPQNTLAGAPAYDRVEAQIDIWAKDAAAARSIARAIRRAVDHYLQITHYVSGFDDESGLYRIACRCIYLTEIDP